MIEIEDIQEKASKPPSDVQSISSQVQPESQIQQTPKQAFPMLLYPFIDLIVQIHLNKLVVSILLVANYTEFSSSFIGYYYDTAAKDSLIESYCYDNLPSRYKNQAQAWIDRCQSYERFYYREFYDRFIRVMTNTQPLVIASFIIAAIISIIVSSTTLNVSNNDNQITFKKVACFVFTVFQTFLIVGFCLIAQYYLNNWNVWSCIILVFVTYASLNICKRYQLQNSIISYILENLAIACLVIPQIALLCYGQAGFKIQSVGLAALFSLNALYWIDERPLTNSSWINSLSISGVFFWNVIASIRIFLIQPCQTIYRFAYKDQNKIKNCSTEQKRNHLIIAYTIMIIIIGMSLFIVSLANYTDIYMLYGKFVFQYDDYKDGYFAVYQYNPLALASYIIVPVSHFISMLFYLKSGQNLISYIISQALLRLEMIFIPILLGALLLIEGTQQMTDSHCVEYSLFFTGLGVIALLGYTIGNTQHNEDKQYKYIFILPVSSLIMIIYQMDYMSIGIGFTAGLLFTIYIHYQSNFIINNNISQVYMDDPIVTATQCMNPVQLVNDFIQYFRDRGSSNSRPTRL